MILTSEGFFNENQEPEWFWNTNHQKLETTPQSCSELMISYIRRLDKKSLAKVISSTKEYVTFKFESNREHSIDCITPITLSFTDKKPARITGNYTYSVETIKAAIMAYEAD